MSIYFVTGSKLIAQNDAAYGLDGDGPISGLDPDLTATLAAGSYGRLIAAGKPARC